MTEELPSTLIRARDDILAAFRIEDSRAMLRMDIGPLAASLQAGLCRSLH